MFTSKVLIKKAKNQNKTIVFPEAGFSDRTMSAVKHIVKKNIANVILIADESALVLQYKKLKNVKIINPKTSSLTSEFAEKIYLLRKEKGVSKEDAEELALDPFYFATMLVREGYADGMIGGAEVSTARNLKPALQLIKADEEYGFVSSVMMFYGKNDVTKNQPFLLADCGLNENPTAEQLSIIAKQSVDFSNALLNQEPRVAFLSYSSHGSAKSDMVEKVSLATKDFKEKYPAIVADGEVQFDSAMIPSVAKTKLKDSYLIKQNANVLILPDLNSANICYKAISYFGKLKAVGPVVLGLKKPINDLSRGATVKDIIDLTAITVLQCK